MRKDIHYARVMGCPALLGRTLQIFPVKTLSRCSQKVEKKRNDLLLVDVVQKQRGERLPQPSWCHFAMNIRQVQM